MTGLEQLRMESVARSQISSVLLTGLRAVSNFGKLGNVRPSGEVATNAGQDQTSNGFVCRAGGEDTIQSLPHAY